MRWFPLSVCATLLTLSGCATNPVTGQRELTLVSEKQEVALGDQNFSYLVQASGGEYTAYPEITAYVNEVGQRLAQVSDRPHLPYEFVIVNQSVPNAWALPGGKIAVNRGLLVELENEGELAAVLSHEIVHAAARHGARNVERGVLFEAGMSGLSQVSGGGKYSNLIKGTADLGAGVIRMQYSREAEREADAYGIEYMARAGYDVQSAVSLQEKFVRLNNQQRRSWQEGMFSSHPPSEERVENNRSTAQQYPSGGKVAKEEYQLRIAPLRAQRAAYEMVDKAELLLNQGTTSQAMTLAASALNKVPAEAHFNGVLAKASAMRGDFAAALEYFDAAIALEENYYDFYLARGLIHLKLGDTRSGKLDLTRSLELLPTPLAHAELGKLAFRQGDVPTAEFHLSAAVKQNPKGAEKEERILHFLQLERNPSDLVKVQPSVDSDGYLLLNVENKSRLDVEDVVLKVTVQGGMGGGTNRREVPVYQKVPAGHRVQIQTDIQAEGSAMWSLHERVSAELLQLRAIR